MDSFFPEPPLTTGLDNPAHGDWDSADYVPMAYSMDPKTEIVIWGSELTNGMKVLAESTFLRSDPGRKARHIALVARGEGRSWNEHDEQQLRESSRWCTVTGLRKPDHNGVISFIGLYEDGTQHVRQMNQSWAWYVKKDTIGADDYDINTGKRRDGREG